MSLGSQIFWGEIEDYLLMNSSEFKSLKDKGIIIRVILAFNRIGRTNETFWKVFSQLYEDFETSFTFDEKLKILNCFAEHMPSMSVHLYKSFEETYLPKPHINLKQLKITYSYDQ
jgi:hypothetical protein